MRIIFILIIIITLRTSLGTSDAQHEYNVTYYERNPGIHFEKLGELRLFNNKFKLITFVEFGSLTEKFLSIKYYYKMTAELCDNNNAQYHYYICDSFLKSAKYSLDKIGKELDILNQLVGHNSVVHRTKRGWFNIVGKATKVLFGVMDEEDAHYYDSKIKEFTEENTSELYLLKEQTKIVQSALIHFNNTIGTLDFNENILRSNVDKLKTELNKNQNEIKFLSLKSNLEEHVTITNMILNQLQLEVMTLTNAILVAKKGILHPAIITPVQLVAELKLVVESLPHGIDFPVPLDSSNANLLLNIIQLQVYFENKRLIYIINIPLAETYLFYLYKISPFPKLVGPNQFILIQPSEKYIALDESKQQFISLSKSEFDNCIQITENKILCKQQQPVSLAHLTNNCEIKLLQGTSKIPDICDRRIVNLDRGIFIQLHTSNTWLFAVPSPESLTISCTNRDKPIDVVLKSCGSVTISKQCKAYSASIMLVPHDNIIQSKMFSEFVPPLELSSDCCETKELKNNFNFSDLLLNENYKSLSKHIPELNLASHKLDEIERLADDIQKKDNASKYQYSGSIIAYILALIMVILIIYKIYKKCCSKTSCCGLVPNLCIRVNQTIEPTSEHGSRYVAHYRNENVEQPETERYKEERVSIRSSSPAPRKTIGYIPSRRPIREK